MLKGMFQNLNPGVDTKSNLKSLNSGREEEVAFTIVSNLKRLGISGISNDYLLKLNPDLIQIKSA
jgi:hypothetical protein